MQLKNRRDALPQWTCACGHTEPSVSSAGAADPRECPQCKIAMRAVEIGLLVQTE